MGHAPTSSWLHLTLLDAGDNMVMQHVQRLFIVAIVDFCHRHTYSTLIGEQLRRLCTLQDIDTLFSIPYRL